VFLCNQKNLSLFLRGLSLNFGYSKVREQLAVDKKTAAKAKAEARKVSVGQGSAAAKADPSKHSVFDLELSALEPFPHINTENCVYEPDGPFVVRDNPLVLKLAEEAPARLSLLVFKAGFGRDPHGREIRVLRSAHGLRQKMLDIAVEAHQPTEVMITSRPSRFLFIKYGELDSLF
jgi:hypothetical protein